MKVIHLGLSGNPDLQRNLNGCQFHCEALFFEDLATESGILITDLFLSSALLSALLSLTPFL
jgi:hypothetical protein